MVLALQLTIESAEVAKVVRIHVWQLHDIFRAEDNFVNRVLNHAMNIKRQLLHRLLELQPISNAIGIGIA